MNFAQAIVHLSPYQMCTRINLYTVQVFPSSFTPEQITENYWIYYPFIDLPEACGWIDSDMLLLRHIR